MFALPRVLYGTLDGEAMECVQVLMRVPRQRRQQKSMP